MALLSPVRVSCCLLTVGLVAAAALAQPPVPLVNPAMIQYGDGVPDGKKSMANNGHLTVFDAGEGQSWLNRVEVFGARYGSETAPDEDFHLYVISLEGEILGQMSLPYSLWEREPERWHNLPIPPIRVPQQFGVGLVFNATKSKGVYVGTELVGESHSYTWVPGSEGTGLWDTDWMIRVRADAQPAGDPQADDLVILVDGTTFFDRVVSAGGDPLMLETAANGRLRWEQVASIRLDAISARGPITAIVTLVNGATVEGSLVALDDETFRIRVAPGVERQLARADVIRLDFAEWTPRPIAAQVEPVRPKRAWGPEQATGPPDTPVAGDVRTAWATREANDGIQWLRLDYEKAVNIAEVRVRETHNPGAVCRVAALLGDGTEVVLWEGEDPTTAAPEDFVVQVQAEVQARSVKVYLDTDRKNGWNEIDAVELVGKDGTRQWALRASASSTYADRGGRELEEEVIIQLGPPHIELGLETPAVPEIHGFTVY